MKNYWIAFSMTQSMFCALPFPCRVWKEEARNKMLLFLPIIGVEIGLLWIGLDWVLCSLDVPALLYGLIMCALPYLATGFIHLEGFLDVTDAICSWRDLEQRRKILKDSHVGAFAVIWCVFLLLAGFALLSSVKMEADAKCLVLVPVVSRCCSAIAVLRLKPMNTSQYANSQPASPRWYAAALAILGIGCVAAGFFLWGKYGWVLVGGLLGYGAALRRSYGILEGMNGDISGFCLTISELCAVVVYVLI